MRKEELLTIFEQYDFHPSKTLGQNYLIDPNMLDFIVRTVAPQASEKILEVGPGFGVLTQKLIESGANVVAVEFDRRACDYLRNTLDASNFTLIESDALRIDFSELIDGDENVRFIANLPYSISSPLIAKMTDLPVPPQYMFFMLQKEMAQRLAAKVGTSAYGALSVRAQALYDVSIIKTVPPEVFFPRPEVASALIQFERKAIYPDFELRSLLGRLTKTVFSQRRKKMLKLMATIIDKTVAEEALAECGISPQARAEEVDIETYLRLSEKLRAHLTSV